MADPTPLNVSNTNPMAFDQVRTLEEAKLLIEQKRGGFGNGDKMMVIALDDSDGMYNISYIQCGMTGSQIIAMLELAKSQMCKTMGY